MAVKNTTMTSTVGCPCLGKFKARRFHCSCIIRTNVNIVKKRKIPLYDYERSFDLNDSLKAFKGT